MKKQVDIWPQPKITGIITQKKILASYSEKYFVDSSKSIAQDASTLTDMKKRQPAAIYVLQKGQIAALSKNIRITSLVLKP